MRLQAQLQVSTLIFAVLLSTSAQAEVIRDHTDVDLVPNGKGWGEHHPAHAKAKPGSGSNGINYHGGPVMLGTTNVYYIWYGNWSGNSATTILDNFANGLNGSPYYNINTTYYDSAPNPNPGPVANSVVLKGQMYNNYSLGKSLSDAGVASVVSSAIGGGTLPADANGVYFVLTSPDVNESSGFCTQYCGWHTHAAVSGVDIKYAFVGNPDRCPSACEAQTVGPNGNAGADAMASIIAHELSEAVTDPDLNAWFDRKGEENGDKCAWNFGATYAAANGASANVNLGGLNYLIQQMWVNANGGSCALSY